MRIESQLTAEAILRELGQRLARRRLDLQLTQAEAADAAGVGKSTVERIEAGQDVRLGGLLRLLRVLDLVDGIEQLVPPTGPRPMDLLRLRGKERQRVRHKKQKTAAMEVAEAPAKWRWGDEA